MPAPPATGADFEAPGPGAWALDRSHYPGGTTPISQWLISEAMGAGMARVFAEIGAPVDRVEARFVHGYMYTRVRPLVGADRPMRRPPPNAILKLATRLHPEFRRRTRRAAATLADRPSVQVAERWDREFRPRLRATNRNFQDVDLEDLTDAELDDHVARLLDHARDTYELHFWLHGHDLGPIARYLDECIGWGIDATDAVQALAGASPSTSRPLDHLVRLRQQLDATDREIRTLDDLRDVSPEVAELVDAYLDEYGAVLATGYDLTAFTLDELPCTVLASIRSARRPDPAETESVVAGLRGVVPADQVDGFDRSLADARAVMDMRDDNGPITAEWPAGLLRHALLEVGRRLADRGDIVDAGHAVDLTPDEARHALTRGAPDGAELAARVARRLALADADPPAVLGTPEPEPPLDVLPEPLARLVAMIQTAMRHLGMDGTATADGLDGVGIGDEVYVGRARTADSADEAIEAMEPGDVLVVRATSPAFNSVLAIAGAVVTANGGAMSHAAVLARELGIPAVVGAGGALAIPDGTTVEVDPVAGSVRVR